MVMSLRDLEQSHADLSRIPSLEPNRLVAFINHVAGSLVQQLNVLNDAADQRLFRLHSRISTCKANLLILEKKLNSIRGLTPAPVVAAEPCDSAAPPVPTPGSSHVPVVSDQDHSDTNTNHEMRDNSVSPAADVIDGDAKNDPELERFYKMLRVGVPLPAVRMKMVSEGVDPERLKL